MSRRIGILTGGGDAPGLNAVIRAFVKVATGQHRWEVVGVEDSFDGLWENPRRLRRLTAKSCQGLLHRGGTILGTTNQGDPFDHPRGGDVSLQVQASLREEKLDGLVCIGGDGTQRIAWRLMQERGVPVIGVPKTIDNDLEATDLTFGFQSAVDVATDALDRLHTTAESHDRVLLLEVMGRDTGHIALSAGIAGGADIILLPEIPYDPHRLAAKVLRRRKLGRPFSIVVVAEGAVPLAQAALGHAERWPIIKKAGGAASLAMRSLGDLLDVDMRTVVLGHLQRGGSPVAFDRVLATRFGVAAAELVAAERWGEMVCLRDGLVRGVPLAVATARTRPVDLDGELVRVARATGIELGG